MLVKAGRAPHLTFLAGSSRPLFITIKGGWKRLDNGLDKKFSLGAMPQCKWIMMTFSDIEKVCGVDSQSVPLANFRSYLYTVLAKYF